MKKNKQLLIKFLIGILFLCGVPCADSAEWQMPPFTIPGVGELIMTEASNDGHVMVVRQGNDEDLSAFYYTNGAWVLSDVLLVNPSFIDTFDVAMSPSGTALAIFTDNASASLFTKYFNGSNWLIPSPNPLDTLIGTYNYFAVGVAMNGNGQGVGVWTDGVDIKAAFFLNGGWTFAQNIGDGNNIYIYLDVAYSSNGTAVAIWYDFNTSSTFVNNFNGITWQPAQQFLTPDYDSLGIDAKGIAYTSWSDGNINITRFNANTSTVLDTQIVSTGTDNYDSSIAVAPNGTAVVVWVDASLVGQSSIFNGSTWSAPIPFTTGIAINPDVSVDTKGNALVVWGADTGEILASRLPLGVRVWSPVELVSEATGASKIFSALSANGIGFAAWNEEADERPQGFANASLLPTSPLAIVGTHCVNKFVTQSDCANVITWAPSIDPTVVAYNLYRNGVLIAIIPASSPFEYVDQTACNNVDIYTVTAVDASGVQSPPAVVIMDN